MQFLLLTFFSYAAFGGSESTNLECNIGVGTAASTGFKWTYDLTNPDVDDEPGKIYWAITEATQTLSVEEIMNPPAAKLFDASCQGSTIQKDEEIHEQELLCPLNVGPPPTDYLFWVAVDYNGDGTSAQDATDGGHAITPEPDVDCDGVWSTCDANCQQEYTVTDWPSGNGAGCTIIMGQTKTCAPGTDDCPMSGDYQVSNPTENGFDLTTTSPDGIPGTSMWYWMVVPVGATPTNDEVKNMDGGLCGGSFIAQSQNPEGPQTVDCNLPTDTYEVVMAEDVSGDGSTIIIGTPQEYISPTKIPEGDLTVHSPNLDTTSFVVTYAVSNPSPTGNLYYVAVPSGAAQPAMSDIVAQTGVTGGLCYGSVKQGDGTLESTTSTCLGVAAGQTYDVYGVTDFDGSGGSAKYTNAGVAQPITFPATTTSTTSTSTSTTSSSTATPGTSSSSTTSSTTAKPNANAGYTVMYPGQYCEADELLEEMGMFDIINLLNVRTQSSTGAYMSDVQACANNVKTNRASNQGCSTLFHTGGAAGICQCLRLGYVCDRDESETGVSIYELTPGSLQGSDPSPEESENVFLWTYIVVFGAAFLATTGASLFYYKNMNNRRLDTYSIPLDHADETYSSYNSRYN